MTSTQVLVFALLIGVLAGLRSLTTLSATAWAAHLGWLGSLPATIGLTLLAVVELVSDKLPKNRAGLFRWDCVHGL